MTLRKTLVASALMLVLGARPPWHSSRPVKSTDARPTISGAVLPGATVTVAGPALIQPRVAVTSETGTYRVPELPIGTYSVTFELAGFRTLALQDIRVTIGFRAQVNGALELVDRAGNRDGHRRQPARRHARDRHVLDVRPRDDAEHSVGARPLGHARAHARHLHGPRQRRRQPVGPAVGLHLARLQHRQQQVVG